MPGVVGDSELAESNSITICLGPISCHRQALALHRKSSDSRFAIDANNSYKGRETLDDVLTEAYKKVLDQESKEDQI
ncbi:MAG: hypothetical protein MHMPM18_003147 [Marteilia pararefringens]